MAVSDFLGDDDGALEAAKILLAENSDELQARIVAQALRLHRQAEKHLKVMHEQQATWMARSEVDEILRVLREYPEIITPTLAFVSQMQEDYVSREVSNGNQEG